MTIPLTLTAGSAEDGDYGSLASITINSGSMSGTGTVTTTEDTDTDDEMFTVALGNLPTSLKAGSPNSVGVTITDGTLPAMSLSASPETVEEGGAVTITATASQTVRANTEVKLVRDGPSSTASDQDFSFDAPQMGVITILDGETSGTLTLTATDDELMEGDESLTLNGLVGDTAVGSVTLTIEDNDTAITYTLSGPADSNIVEGRSYELTATDSSRVQADTTVEILRNAAASDAGEDDYSVEPILIEAGETAGTTTLMVTADDLPDGGTGTNRGETLMLFGTVGGMEILQSHVIQRILCIRVPGSTGSAFIVEVGAKQYIVTAAHVVDPERSGSCPSEILVRRNRQWTRTPVRAVGLEGGSKDIAVMTAAEGPIVVVGAQPDLSEHIAFSQEVRFLGYPYGWDGGSERTANGYPFPFVKAGIVSAILGPPEPGDATNILIDAHGNPGFSGGPVVFTQLDAEARVGNPFAIVGVVSGNLEDEETRAHLGFVRAAGIQAVVEMIERNPIGAALPEGVSRASGSESR